MISVGLPVWHGEEIAWLAMESLCRQETSEPWELLICEEAEHGLGTDFYAGYRPRLIDAGCGAITYIEPASRVPLSRKWREIITKTAVRSRALVLQSADCYSEPLRIQRTADLVAEGYDWIQQRQGAFYDIESGGCILYDHAINTIGLTALNMAIALDMARRIAVGEDRWNGVDGWLYRSARAAKPDLKTITHNEERWRRGVDTHGRNVISKYRSRYFARITPPFRETEIALADCVPADVRERLTTMRKAVAV